MPDNNASQLSALPLFSNSTTDQRMRRVRMTNERTQISWSGCQVVSFRSLRSTTRSLTTLGSKLVPATWTVRTWLWFARLRPGTSTFTRITLSLMLSLPT